jgi:hypothetical protein
MNTIGELVLLSNTIETMKKELEENQNKLFIYCEELNHPIFTYKDALCKCVNIECLCKKISRMEMCYSCNNYL